MKTISDDLKERCRDLNCILLEQIKEPGATFISLDSYKNLVKYSTSFLLDFLKYPLVT